jgi:hypothetical protein
MSEHPLNAIDKVQRYKWVVKDRKGELLYVSKHLLRIDPIYQREQSDEKVQEMRKNWSWIACGALAVARREDNSLWIMDGGHRYTAAMDRLDIPDLPCVVFNVESIKQEAKGFLDIQMLRKNISSADKFKALLTVEDQTAMFVNRLLEESGRKAGVTATPTSVSCLSAMLILAEKRPEVLTTVFPLVADLCRGHSIHVNLLVGLAHLEYHLRKTGHTLKYRKWVDRLNTVGREGLLSASKKFAEAHGRGTPAIYAKGMINVLNKGRWKDLIPDIDVNDKMVRGGNRVEFDNQGYVKRNNAIATDEGGGGE